MVHVFKQMFLVFKQYYTYFHTLFHLHIFSKNTNNVTRTRLPNDPLSFKRWDIRVFRLIKTENSKKTWAPLKTKLFGLIF